MVVAWTLISDPSENYLECNGQAVDAAKYPKLYNLMHNTPDYRGIFLRGYGSQNSYHWKSTQHSSAGLGELQGDAIRNIYGEFNDTVATNNVKFSYGVFTISTNITGGDGGDSGPTGFGETYKMLFNSSLMVPTSNENRPINKAVRYFIKAK